MSPKMLSDLVKNRVEREKLVQALETEPYRVYRGCPSENYDRCNNAHHRVFVLDREWHVATKDL